MPINSTILLSSSFPRLATQTLASEAPLESADTPLAVTGLRQRWAEQSKKPTDIVHWLKQTINHYIQEQLERVSAPFSAEVQNAVKQKLEDSIQRDYIVFIQYASQFSKRPGDALAETPLWYKIAQLFSAVNASIDRLLSDREITKTLSTLSTVDSKSGAQKENLFDTGPHREEPRSRPRRAPTGRDPIPSTASRADEGQHEVETYHRLFSELREIHGHSSYWKMIATEAQSYPQYIHHLSELLKNFFKAPQGNQALATAAQTFRSVVSRNADLSKDSDYLSVQLLIQHKLVSESQTANPYNLHLIKALTLLTPQFHAAETQEKKTPTGAYPIKGSPFQQLCLEALERTLPASHYLNEMAEAILEIHQSKAPFTSETVNALVESKLYLPTIRWFWSQATRALLENAVFFGFGLAHPSERMYSANSIRDLNLGILRIGFWLDTYDVAVSTSTAEQVLIQWLIEADTVQRHRRWFQLMENPQKLYRPNNLYSVPDQFYTAATPTQRALIAAMDVVPADLKVSVQAAFHELVRKGVLNTATLGLLVAYPDLALDIALAVPSSAAPQNWTKIYAFCKEFVHLTQTAGEKYQLALLLNVPPSRLDHSATGARVAFRQARLLLSNEGYTISEPLNRELKNAGVYAVEFANALLDLGQRNYEKAHQEQRWADVFAAFMRYTLTQPAYYEAISPTLAGPLLSSSETDFKNAFQEAVRKNRIQKARAIGRLIGVYLQETNPMNKAKRWLALMSSNATAPLFPDPEPRVKSIVKRHYSLDEITVQLAPREHQAAVRETLSILSQHGPIHEKIRSILLVMPELSRWMIPKLSQYDPVFFDALSRNVVFGMQDVYALKTLADLLKIPESQLGYQQIRAKIETRLTNISQLVGPVRQQFIQTYQYRRATPEEVNTLINQLTRVLNIDDPIWIQDRARSASATSLLERAGSPGGTHVFIPTRPSSALEATNRPATRPNRPPTKL